MSPAIIVKGIIISLAVVAAVGFALQQPEVQDWIEEQRRKLVHLLRNLGEGLDAHTRRQAEAFAYHGELPTQREAEGMSNAAAVATGRDIDRDATNRRLTRQASATAEELAERRRLGREYLARRNQELLDRRNRTISEKDSTTIAVDVAEIDGDVPRLTEKSAVHDSFEHLVNKDGTLRLDEKQSLPSPPRAIQDTSSPVPVAIRGLDTGSFFASPFGDEYALDYARSETPKPPRPPKIAIEEPASAAADPPVSVPTVFAPPAHVPDVFAPPVSVAPSFNVTAADLPASAPGSWQDEPVMPNTDLVSFEGLDEDEQLRQALYLSLAENEEAKRQSLHRTQTEEEDLAKAIAESLKVAESSSQRGPLVDFSQDAQSALPNASAPIADDDDLYTVTPMLTGVRRTAESRALPSVADASRQAQSSRRSDGFGQSQHSSQTTSDGISSPSTWALSPLMQPRSPLSTIVSPGLAPLQEHLRGFETDSDHDDFASVQSSVAHSEASLVEVEVVDIDSMSDDDGIDTPQSWSDVGSEVDESEASERSRSEAGDLVRL